MASRQPATQVGEGHLRAVDGWAHVELLHRRVLGQCAHAHLVTGHRAGCAVKVRADGRRARAGHVNAHLAEWQAALLRDVLGCGPYIGERVAARRELHDPIVAEAVGGDSGGEVEEAGDVVLDA